MGYSYYPEFLARGERRTRRVHRCFECDGTLPAGSTVHFDALTCEGSAYTLYSHPDCAEMADAACRELDLDYDGGRPPMWDCLRDHLEPDQDPHGCPSWRGRFPHAFNRLAKGWGAFDGC